VCFTFYRAYATVFVHIGFYMQSIVYASCHKTTITLKKNLTFSKPYVMMFCNMFSEQSGGAEGLLGYIIS
jgi:hypothetical protein